MASPDLATTKGPEEAFSFLSPKVSASYPVLLLPAGRRASYRLSIRRRGQKTYETGHKGAVTFVTAARFGTWLKAETAGRKSWRFARLVRIRAGAILPAH